VAVSCACVVARGISEVSLRNQAVERANRLPDLVDDDLPFTQRIWSEEVVRNAVDRYDLVLVVAAVERDVPPGCGVTDGEIEALVLHLTDIHNRWAGDT